MDVTPETESRKDIQRRPWQVLLIRRLIASWSSDMTHCNLATTESVK